VREVQERAEEGERELEELRSVFGDLEDECELLKARMATLELMQAEKGKEGEKESGKEGERESGKEGERESEGQAKGGCWARTGQEGLGRDSNLQSRLPV